MFQAIADVLRSIGNAIATVVTLPFRALARLFGGGGAKGDSLTPPVRLSSRTAARTRTPLHRPGPTPHSRGCAPGTSNSARPCPGGP
jgi:hypothetical protein